MTDVLGDTEFTELVDANVPRVDLVGRPANGSAGFLLMKQDAQAGLMPPAAIRGLIGKTAEPEPEDDKVTLTGSPGAIAKVMHEAALRARQRDEVSKAEMSTKNINDLPDSDFAYVEPGGEKDDEGKTTPRSLRHFPIHDEAHVRNALSRAPQSPNGDKAMPKIRAAAKKFGIDVAKEAPMDDDVLDPTVLLAESDGDAPGMDTDPGSPAWEAVDAATARKWTALLARAKAAIDMLAQREMLEAAAGDEDDAENAFDLQDACCAIDYAISVLAPFAVSEQAEADCCDDMAMVGKALHGFDSAPLDTIEALTSVAKAGRVLSTANEAAIRGAVESLQKVLASLPAAPTADDVTKTANEEGDMPEPTPSAETTAASGQEPAMGVQQADPKPVAGAAVTDMAKAEDAPEKSEMTPVYDAEGNLIGAVDPKDLTVFTSVQGKKPSDGDDMETEAEGDDAAPETTDLTPEPPAEAGTPADAVPTEDDEAVTKTTNNNDTSGEVLKSSFLAAVEQVFKTHSATQEEAIAKTGVAVLELADMVETLKGRLQVLEEQPAEPRVFTNGAVPPRDQMRGQDRGAAAAHIDLAKAREQKDALYKAADATEQNRIAQDMQASAIDALQAIHQRRA